MGDCVEKAKRVVGWLKSVSTHRSKNGIHELVQGLFVHEVTALYYSHGELRDDGEVGLEVLAYGLAKLVVLLEGVDLLDLSEGIEGVVI